MQNYSDSLFCLLQKILPQHQLSRLIAKVAEAKTPWLKNALIRQFIRSYSIDLSIASRELPEQYLHFNDFFTRALKPESRPITADANTLISPADGTLSQFGAINNNQFIQAKGQSYTTSRLLAGNNSLAEEFSAGSFATVYLSPSDYHRVHMPWTGTLLETHYIPGKLFSVNQATAREIPELFAQNERLICVFATSFGKMAVILVGAMLVAGIETVWHGHYVPATAAVENFSDKDFDKKIHFSKGDEIGRFKFGSTVVLILQEQVDFNDKLSTGDTILMGQNVALSRTAH